ncbi:hypothetical protein E3N88_27412 [Mikania micrantha]|uniref:Uncharacterized protein n=1 Tax=Mikania micrantha TaxID=192012 RepID=A0A5N6MX87_9ASTR|nr:hypothetical protein E3N88_27412 [Mikania micrantha]
MSSNEPNLQVLAEFAASIYRSLKSYVDPTSPNLSCSATSVSQDVLVEHKCDSKFHLPVPIRSEVPKVGQTKFSSLCSLPFKPHTTQPATFGGQIQISLKKSAAFICAAALNARMGAEQTQTVTRQSSTITIAPVQGKEKSPDLDDGGTGLPPRDDDGGGGGGGGGGGWSSGGFFFFGFLAFLGFLKDQEKEGTYRDDSFALALVCVAR